MSGALRNLLLHYLDDEDDYSLDIDELFDTITLPTRHEEMISKLRDVPVSTEKGSTECVVCLQAEKNVLLYPCKHLCCCASCALQLIQPRRDTKCPVCKTIVTNLDRVFPS